MSQIELADGTLVWYLTMAFEMVDNVDSEREAAERVSQHMRKKLIRDTGENDDLANRFRPYMAAPYAPELGRILDVGEAGSPSSAAVITGAFRALGPKAEQFQSSRKIRNAGSVEVDGETYYYDGNDVLKQGKASQSAPACVFFRTLDQVEDHQYDLDCDK